MINKVKNKINININLKMKTIKKIQIQKTMIMMKQNGMNKKFLSVNFLKVNIKNYHSFINFILYKLDYENNFINLQS